MGRRIRKPLFHSPIVDETAIARAAATLAASRASPLTGADILSVAGQHGTDIATRYLYESIQQSRHAAFINRIQTQSDTDCLVPARLKLLVIPGMFYVEHPETGTDGQLILDIAARLSIPAELVRVDSTGALADNARLISRHLSSQRHHQLWVMTISKGSADFMYYLKQTDTTPVTGWVNVCGIHRGLPLIEEICNSLPRRLFFNLYARLNQISPSLLADLHPGNSLWQHSCQLEPSNIINIVPMPLASHVQAGITRHYLNNLKLGPNDGFVPLTDALALPGNLYPLWGCDHFARTPMLSRLVYRLLRVICANTKE